VVHPAGTLLPRGQRAGAPYVRSYPAAREPVWDGWTSTGHLPRCRYRHSPTSTITSPGGTISKIVAQLDPGDIVTTLEDTVDRVARVGVAELRGRSLREPAASLIAVAHPDNRDRLTFDAQRVGYP